MMVKIIDRDAAGTETVRGVCDLHECFPDDSRDESGRSEFLWALEVLKVVGRVWVGGGAAPLVLLMRVEP